MNLNIPSEYEHYSFLCIVSENEKQKYVMLTPYAKLYVLRK